LARRRMLPPPLDILRRQGLSPGRFWLWTAGFCANH